MRATAFCSSCLTWSKRWYTRCPGRALPSRLIAPRAKSSGRSSITWTGHDPSLKGFGVLMDPAVEGEGLAAEEPLNAVRDSSQSAVSDGTPDVHKSVRI